MAQRNQSKFKTHRQVDDPLVQNADFEHDADDRQYVDNQVRAIQEYLVEEAIPAIEEGLGGGAGTPGGSNGQIQYNNAGAFGGLASTGTGDVVRATSPTLVTPVIGAATGTSAALSSFWSTGASPATTGAGRMSDGQALYSRSGGTNYRLLEFSAGILNIGESGTGVTDIIAYGQNSITFAIGTTTKAFIDTNGLKLNDGTGQYYTIGVSNLSADRTVTLPLLTGNDTFVTEAHTQTLTNKTLTSPTLTTPVLGAATATSVAASSFFSQGATPATGGAWRMSNNTEIQFRNAANSGNLTALFVNSSDQVNLGFSTATAESLVWGTSVYLNGANHTLRSADGVTTYASWSSSTATLKQSALVADGNARCKAYSNIANVQTTDATVTSLYTWTILDEAHTLVTAEVVNCISTGATGAAYVRRTRFERDGGTVATTAVEDSYTNEDTAGNDCTIDNSTSTGRVRVTGTAATTIDWGGVTNRIEVSHA